MAVLGAVSGDPMKVRLLAQTLLAILCLCLAIGETHAGPLTVKKGDVVLVTVDETDLLDKDMKPVKKAKRNDSFAISRDSSNVDHVPAQVTINGSVVDAFLSSDMVRPVSEYEKYLSQGLILLSHVPLAGRVPLTLVFVSTM